MKKDIFAGLSLGFLIGGIIGLSIEHVTGIILGALTSLLAAFFGLKPNKEGVIGNQIIIGTFGITCMISILGGLYIRTNNILSPSIKKDIDIYQQAQFTKDEIKRIILVKKLGLIPNGFNFNEAARSLKDDAVLMSEEHQKIYLCNAPKLDSSLNSIQRSFDYSGYEYQELEHLLTQSISDTNTLKKVLMSVKGIICEN